MIKYCSDVLVSGNHIAFVARDGIGVWDDPNVIVTDNIIENVNDDAISAHTDNAAASPPRSGVTITDNSITESQGISVGGAKDVLISGNVLKRMLGSGIQVWTGTTTQGSTSEFNVTITNNVISNVFTRAEPNPFNGDFWYIRISGSQSKGSSLIPSFGSGVGSLV